MPWLLDQTNSVSVINDGPSVLHDLLTPVGEDPGVGLLTEGGLTLLTEAGDPILTEGNPS